jgi:transcriptional regulator
MYIPKINLAGNREEIVAFMQQFSFATLITAKDGLPVASHLPFVVTAKEDNIILTAHFAKANEQWQDIEQNKVLVIFSEPHAYISPKNYDKELSVPTWNYISVHAYGQGKLITETAAVMTLMEEAIDNFETAYKQQWNNLPADYKSKMLNGIIAFEIVVTDLQAKKKLSQNKTGNEKKKIIDHLSKSNDSNEKLIADYMSKA